jgi:fumarylacetoacetase
MTSTTQCWIDGVDGSLFSLDNLPFGVRSVGTDGHVCTRVGAHVVDLHSAADAGLFDDSLVDALQAPTLNALMASGRPIWQAVRQRIGELLSDAQFSTEVQSCISDEAETVLVMPFDVADYVDFYSSEQHAKNVSEIFGAEPGAETPYLPEHWYHMPIAYHGRAGTVVVSETPVRRPYGQRRPKGERLPVYGPSRRLDIEAEVGFVVGPPSAHGEPVPAESFADHVFGVVLVNDWSARDLQAWESVPLGPFLGKSFATSISPWVVPLDALRAARKPIRTQSPAVLPYLHDIESWCLDLTLEVRLNGCLVSRPPFATQYWSPGQQLAHLTVNGASLRTGDLFASGTVTGPERDERGSLLELTWGGREPLTLEDGSERTFLEDGDTVVISATAPAPSGGRVSLGDVVGQVVAD